MKQDPSAQRHDILKILGEVTAGADHEINNLLFIIEGTSNLLLEPTESVESKSRSLDIISEKVQKIHKVMQELREVIRDGHEDPISEIQVNELGVKLSDLCKTRYRNHKVIFNITMDKPVAIRGRQTEIIQSVLGVLNFCHSRIRKDKNRWIKINLVEDTKGLCLEIEDSGLPFTKEEMSHSLLNVSKKTIESNQGRVVLKNVKDQPTVRIYFDKVTTAAEASIYIAKPLFA